jgi:hypothetical protein
MTLTALEGEGLTEDEIVAEAYAHVAEGYRRALAVGGLPAIKVDDLRYCAIAAQEIAGEGLRSVGGSV